jgi:hypothetical protein
LMPDTCSKCGGLLADIVASVCLVASSAIGEAGAAASRSSWSCQKTTWRR